MSGLRVVGVRVGWRKRDADAIAAISTNRNIDEPERRIGYGRFSQQDAALGQDGRVFRRHAACRLRVLNRLEQGS